VTHSNPQPFCPVLITNTPDIAVAAERAGVGRIMVDLERNGKFERQKMRDTWISQHQVEDIAPVARALSRTELMVRINPFHERSAAEIDQAIQSGADCIMLPMFHSAQEANRIGAMIAGRCRFIPLVETAEAMAELEQLARSAAVDEVFIGLNDLHMSLGLDFMFEPLGNGMLDIAAETLRASGKPFGFGGIARLGEGDLPAEFIMRDHARLGSTRVNLSRTFAHDGLEGGAVFEREVRALLDVYDDALLASAADLQNNHNEVKSRVRSIAARIRTNQEHAQMSKQA